ncbi:MAG: hypothetical protein J5J04_01805, partial [Anaerolineae bacterium]|nr:hypothetical protein [Anaerolineae bacterium]
MMNRRTTLTVSLLLLLSVCLTLLPGGRTLAQDAGQNPTPIIISLTPPGGEATPPGGDTTPPSEPTGTAENGLTPDRFEPNDDANAATPIGFQTETGLTL